MAFETESPLPALGSVWRHYNNKKAYTVLMVANAASLGTDREEEFPPTIVYRDESGVVWARTLDRWRGKFITTGMMTDEHLKPLDFLPLDFFGTSTPVSDLMSTPVSHLMRQVSMVREANARLRAECDLYRGAAQEVLDLRVEVAALREKSAGMQGHGEPCYYCGEPCDSLTGNPSMWPIPLCHSDEPGRVKRHHSGCVSRRLIALDAAVAELKREISGAESTAGCSFRHACST